MVSAAPGGERDPIHWHVDQTFSLPYSPGWHVAHFVDVLYVRVPARMEGGRLEVQKVPDPWLDEHGLRARALYELEYGEPPSLNASIKPANNKLVTFRGDAHHRVRPFAAAADDRRVSIVLESYVLPRLDIWRARRLVPTFQIG